MKLSGAPVSILGLAASVADAQGIFKKNFESDVLRVMVKHKNAKGKAHTVASANSIHYDIEKQNAVAATYQPAAAIEALSRNTNVDYVEPDIKRYIIGGLRAEEIMSVPAHPSSFEHDVGAPVHYKLDQTVPCGIVKDQADHISPSDTSKTVIIVD